mgnify:CR=1 FL=1
MKKNLIKAISDLKITYRGDTVIIDRRQWEAIEVLIEETDHREPLKNLMQLDCSEESGGL